MDAVLQVLENPNVAYLMLWAGIMMALFAVLTPGTGVLEIGALISLALATYSILNTPINFWALGVLLLGVVFFFLAVRFPTKLIFLVLAIVFLVVGSIFLFRGENAFDPAVNPFLALIVSGLSAAFFWVVTRKVMEARSAMPTHDLKNLIGEQGEAKTTIHHDGSVQIGSELWSARSETVIPRGSLVRIVSRDGFTLDVEPLEESES